MKSVHSVLELFTPFPEYLTKMEREAQDLSHSAPWHGTAEPLERARALTRAAEAWRKVVRARTVRVAMWHVAALVGLAAVIASPQGSLLNCVGMLAMPGLVFGHVEYLELRGAQLSLRSDLYWLDEILSDDPA